MLAQKNKKWTWDRVSSHKGACLLFPTGTLAMEHHTILVEVFFLSTYRSPARIVTY